jgi:metal-responsive CopG/Arc/MetJ family transcriptional regulator
MMSKISVWLPTSELSKIDDLKGDISRSHFVRRAIRKAISEENVVLSGKGLPTDSSEAASAVEEVFATQTTTPHKGSNQEEVELSS